LAIKIISRKRKEACGMTCSKVVLPGTGKHQDGKSWQEIKKKDCGKKEETDLEIQSFYSHLFSPLKHHNFFTVWTALYRQGSTISRITDGANTCSSRTPK
jgi:hypothetical protein